MLRRFVCALFGHRWVALYQGVRECARCKARQQWLFSMKMRMNGDAKVEWKWQ